MGCCPCAKVVCGAKVSGDGAGFGGTTTAAATAATTAAAAAAAAATAPGPGLQAARNPGPEGGPLFFNVFGLKCKQSHHNLIGSAKRLQRSRGTLVGKHCAGQGVP
eukprot:gene11812-biopygen22920